MRAVTFQAPGEVRVDERPEPELRAPDDAIVAVEASGICGSDLHLYRGRIPLEPGFTLGHEYVGTVTAAGDAVRSVAVGDRVLGAFHVACGACAACRRARYQACERSRTFGHGRALGDLQGTQADRALVPHANLTLRRVPDGMGADVALFAGDVMGTGYHATAAAGVRAGDAVAVIGLGPVGLCAVQAARAAGAAPIVAVDTIADRLELAGRFGARPVHATEEDPRAAVKAATEGRGVRVAVEAVGDAAALDLAIRLAAPTGVVSIVGVHSARCEVHMGLIWIKSLELRAGQANVIAHLDHVLALLHEGILDPRPLVSHHLPLDRAPEGYELFARREALKIVLEP